MDFVLGREVETLKELGRYGYAACSANSLQLVGVDMHAVLAVHCAC